MRILEYSSFNPAGFEAKYRKVAAAIEHGDFRAAQVKKLTAHGSVSYYRARLDDSNRLLFTLLRCGEQSAALMLEIIPQHNYDKSRFLRGSPIDETKIPDVDAVPAVAQARPLRYLHPERNRVHVLDKPISFDDAQQALYEKHPPLIVVGSAGSGKTALTLEKMKHAEGEVLYVTHSAFLAQNARDLYYAQGFEHSGQDALFLSFREFLETLRVPEGREASWPAFAGWFGRMRQQFKDIDAHQAFEEIRGVLAASAAGVLDRQRYAELGVRQSIFAASQREKVYELFAKYRAWLHSERLFDLNLLAHERMSLALPHYDFVVIDEVQDLTAVQLALILKTLKKPGNFLLCGDSNQIVHPNFFSWSQVKTLFWRDPELAAKQTLQVLTANFRNAAETTRIANTLLKIKHRRFGSIDRASNFLVDAIGADPGQATLLEDRDTVKRDLDVKTRQSAQFAVLVMRDEDKAAARAYFRTPLLFSVQEAKGLEYENIVLYRFVSDHRTEFSAIVEDVSVADLAVDALDYRRARDKADKSLEVYKFFVNALYVAITRAVKNLYLIESDTAHPLFALLNLRHGEARLEAKASSRDDWQREARRLELQGKQEQAEAIRRDILKTATPPWPVFDEARLRALLVKTFRDRALGSKHKQQLLEYAACHDQPALAQALQTELGFGTVTEFIRLRPTLGRKHLGAYASNSIKDVLRQCEQFGLEHRTAMNLTPLMAAAAAGNIHLVDALIDRGADPAASDHYGHCAMHWAMRHAFEDPRFARGGFAAILERVAPSHVDVQSGQRLVRIDRHLTEYFLFQTLWALFPSCFYRHSFNAIAAFDTATILEAWEHLPNSVLKSERNKRAHLSAVLSRNEVDRDYAYNRALFKRMELGWYQFNPALAVRVHVGAEEHWTPIFQVLNLPLIHEATQIDQLDELARLLNMAGSPAPELPLANAAYLIRREAELRKLQEEHERLRREATSRAKLKSPYMRSGAARANARRDLAARSAQEHAEPSSIARPDPPWGTPEAKALALKRLQEQIDQVRKAGGNS